MKMQIVPRQNKSATMKMLGTFSCYILRNTQIKFRQQIAEGKICLSFGSF